MQKNSGAGKSPAEPVLVTIDCSHLEENARDSMSPAPHDIAELEPAELESLLADSGYEPFHARQIYRWIYRYGVTDFGRMTDLSRALRGQLQEQFVINTPRIVDRKSTRL